MRFLLRLFSVFVLISFFAADAWAAKPKILLLKDLEPGTKAIGFSVFRGVEPEPFNVDLGEPIDQLGSSFILVRIYGKTSMDTPLEKMGAIAGMSGSPIFVGCSDLEDCTQNGTLVGALSYSVGYFIEGGMNALITPAEYMLGARTSGYVAASHFSNGLLNKMGVGGKEFVNLMLFPKMENIQVSGNSNSRCKESLKSDIKPGSMVSVFLATGTVNVGASGTVTWRDKQNIYIFGHPLMGDGMVEYPFVQVSVANTIQTPVNASKITGCYLDTKGAILVDGAYEMAGVIGKTASMLPYQVEMHVGHDRGTFYEEIAASSLAPVVIQMLPVFWAEQLLGDLSNLSLSYQFRITLTDKPEIFVRNIIPAWIYKNPFDKVFNNVYHPIKILKESGFGYRLESLKVRLEVIQGFKLWTVKKSFLSQKKASPGETVYANVVLEEFFSSDVKQISIPIKVPGDYLERDKYAGVPSQINLLIQSGNKFTDKRAATETDSLADLVEQLNHSMNYKTNVLYVQQIMPKSKVEQESDISSAKASVKPAWKWTDVGESDLRQLPVNNKSEVVLTLSPALNNFLDLNLTFDLQIEKKNEKVENKKETKHRKWFRLFLF